ncbi:3'-5' exonuclease family protein [Nostoc sp.]
MDSEFIENGSTIDLISIGIVAEDGRQFYAINWDCDYRKANDWVKANVLVHLPFRPNDSPGKEGSAWKTRSVIRDAIATFLGCEYRVDKSPKYALKEGVEKPEFWTYYGSYDW